MAANTPRSSAPTTRLYLATPPLDDAAGFEGLLASALEAADIAAVLLRLAPADDRTLIKRIKAVAPAIQQRGIAVLLDGHLEIVARAGADGAHISGIDNVKDALSALKPDRIVGAGGLALRHDAMTAGEAGADYVLFGEPDQNGHRPKLEAIVERLQWWAEVFEPPCVGYAGAPDEVGPLAATGADFVLLDQFVWSDPRGPQQAVRDAANAIAETMASPLVEHRA